MSNLSRTLLRLLLGGRLPVTSGSLPVQGPAGPVTVRREKHGIPMIEAGDELDAFFGLGFCQGQDRAFQIELTSRAARGTLSALFGPRTLQVDRLLRRVGFYRAAQEQFRVLDPSIAAALEAFAGGVNAGRTLGLPRKPHEMFLLRAEFTGFTAADVLAILKVQCFAMPSNWDAELARLTILNKDGPQALRDLDPAYPAWHRVASPPGAAAGRAAERLAEDIARFADVVGIGGASNSWAVSGARTRSGRPLLANDPHLSPSIPPHWYLARLQTPGWSLAGAALAGTPAVAVGHNGACAWGVTAGLTDNTDLYVERIGPGGTSVLDGEEYVDCEVRREVIEVKGAEDVVEEVLITPRGPIIGPALHPDQGAISMRAVWLEPLPALGFLGIKDAGTFDEFRAPFAHWPLLPLNLVYADAAGNIGYQLVGQAPRRRRGWGALPGAGWDPGSAWEPHGVPFEEMPRSFYPAQGNPGQGFVASANNQPEPEGTGPFLGVDWIDGYRVGRILQALEERSDWDAGSTAALQMDVKSLPWEEMRDVVLRSASAFEGAGFAGELLEGWDGMMAVDSAAATLFHFFSVEMSGRLARARAPRSARWALGEGFHPAFNNTFFTARQAGRLSRLLREQPEGWFEHGWPAEIGAALAAAAAAVRGRLGPDTARWGWGRVRPLTLRHPFGTQRWIGEAFNLGPFPWPGDFNTIAQAGSAGADVLAAPSVAASMRMVLDVGAWDDSLFSLPGGQSGNPLSPHYSDLLPAWKEGRGVPIPWSREAVQAAAVETLRLTPA